MSDVHSGGPIPRGVLIGTAVLLGTTLVLAGFSRVTGIGKTTNPTSEPIERIALHFEDRSDGAVAIYREPADAAARQPIGVLDPGTNGFIRGVVRGLVRERRANGVGAAPPFALTRWADGRISLEDPSTGRNIELSAFGPTNARAFADLLQAGGTP